MEYQNIDKTRCCHRLYELLVRSSEHPLVGEPWFRFVAGGLYFSSRTTSDMVANVIVAKRDLEGRLLANSAIDAEVLLPFKKYILEEDSALRNVNASKKQMDLVLCRTLGDFFRLNYQKLN